MDRRTFFAAALVPGLAFQTRTGSGRSLDDVLGGRQGSALVVDVVSGRMLAASGTDMASKRLTPPGSVIKPFVLATLLEKEIVQPTTSWKCGRTLRILGRNLDCSHVETGEPFAAVEALAYSCNNYFAHFASRLQPQELVASLTSWGLTGSTKLVRNEVTGSVMRPETTEHMQLLALGEWGIRVTALEVAMAYRRIALIRREANPPTARFKAVFEGLSAAAGYGTARLARTRTREVAGKTGTANDGTSAHTHAWFAGYAPPDRPEFVVVVFLESGSGGGDAAPIASKIFSAL